jgi:uncharacterized protein (DUF433 family)
MSETELLARITINPQIYGGKPIIRGRRIAVEHILGMLAAGDTAQTIVDAYPYLDWRIFAPASSLPDGWSAENA